MYFLLSGCRFGGCLGWHVIQMVFMSDGHARLTFWMLPPITFPEKSCGKVIEAWKYLLVAFLKPLADAPFPESGYSRNYIRQN